MTDLMARMCSPEVLHLAWQFVRKDKGCWTPDLRMSEVMADLDWHLDQLGREVQTGRYRPYPLFCFEVAKPSGGARLVCAPCARDKLLQRAALMLLEPLAEQFFHPASFGYRPLCTVDMAVARLREGVRQGYIWLGDADIAQCFDTIPQAPVLDLVEALADDSSLGELIAQWFATLPARYRTHGHEIGLPQGLAISPLLCNLYLHELDMDLEEAGIPFVRYADNFMVMARDEDGAAAALEFAARSVERLGLALNLEKTGVLKSRASHRFLGKRLPNPREPLAP